MALIDLAVVAAIAGLFVWLLLDQRRRIRRQAHSKLRSTVLRTAADEIVFDGARALVLLEDYIGLGGDNGPSHSAKYLCKMPDAGAYWVVVDLRAEEAQASVEVSALSQTEVDEVLATYPYLKQLKSHLTRGA